MNEVRPILKQLFAAFPNSQAGEGTIAVYLRLLQDIPALELQIVVDQCIAECKFLPTVAELRDCWHSLTVDLQFQTAAEAWGSVTRAFGRVWHTETPRFKNPITARAVQIMGWRALCVSENQIADRAHFMKIYEQLLARQEREHKLLPQARQLVERHAGLRPIGAILSALPVFAPAPNQNGP